MGAVNHTYAVRATVMGPDASACLLWRCARDLSRHILYESLSFIRYRQWHAAHLRNDKTASLSV